MNNSLVLRTPKGAESWLNSQVDATLKARLSGPGHYTKAEIADIVSYPFKLFPAEFLLTDLETKKLRALSALSQCHLKPARSISSHRKLIGPAIVAIKRLSWPFVKIHLKDTLEGVQAFQAWTVKSIADLIVSSRNH